MEEFCVKVLFFVFYNKFLEIDIICWDVDLVLEEEEGFEGGD